MITRRCLLPRTEKECIISVIKTKDHNAVAEAKTPVMDKLMAECPFVKGNASGMAVGLPEGQMGNSEVGHMNMGAGRIVYQELTRITKEIQDGTFFENPALLEAKQDSQRTYHPEFPW